MSSLSALVAVDGPLHLGIDPGPDVRVLQIALLQAGYRVDIDKDGRFTDDTDFWLRRFQKQHGFEPTGVLDRAEAEVLDAPHADVIAAATPLVHPATGFPHDDTASLIAFYGYPTAENLETWKAAHVVTVSCPWTLYYGGQPWHHPIQFHKKAAPAFADAMQAIWAAAAKDDRSPILRHVRNFSGSGELRAVRGSSRISTHGFWAAIDYDADKLPLGHDVSASEMPQKIVDAFIASGAFWGGNYIHRKDPMHFQYAHE